MRPETQETADIRSLTRELVHALHLALSRAMRERMTLAFAILASGATIWNALDAYFSYQAVVQANVAARSDWSNQVASAKNSVSQASTVDLQGELRHATAMWDRQNHLKHEVDDLNARLPDEMTTLNYLPDTERLQNLKNAYDEALSDSNAAVSQYNSDQSALPNAQKHLADLQRSPPAPIPWSQWPHYAKVEIAILCCSFAGALIALTVLERLVPLGDRK